MTESFGRRVGATLCVWVAGLVVWLLMIGLFSTEGLLEVRHVVLTLAGLADVKLCVAQLLGVCVLTAMAWLLGGLLAKQNPADTIRLFLSETMTVCVNFAVIFALGTVLSIAAIFLNDPSLLQSHLAANAVMMVLNATIAYLVWLRIK